MLIFKNYRKFLKIIIIFQILNVFLITSCTLKDFDKNNGRYFYDIKNKPKTLIVPKGINIFKENQEYNIPYTENDLKKENYDIFPPI